jgi:hypothetical protein
MGAASRKSGLEKHLALKIGYETTRKIGERTILEMNASLKTSFRLVERYQHYTINSKLWFAL